MKNLIKRWLLGFLGVSFITIAIACGGSSDDDELTSVSLALDWFANSNHVGIFEAVKRGYFLEEGLDVNVYTPADPSTVLQTVGAGRDDFGISYQPDLLLARSAEVPVVSIMGLVQHPLNSVMALASSGIESPGDLKGMKVGHPNIPSNQGMLATMLAEEGLTLDDVEMVDVGFSLVEALLGGQVDAIVGAYWTHESIRIELQGEPVNIMRMEEWGVPDFYELVLTASEDTIRDRPEVVEKFVRAMRRGFEAANENPQASIDTLLELNPDTVDEELERRGVDLLQPMWTAGAPSIGWQERSRWESFADWMKSQGFIGEDVDPNSAFTNQFAAN